MSPGKVMRVCSLLGALVHTGKDEIMRWCNEERQEEGTKAGGPNKKSV